MSFSSLLTIASSEPSTMEARRRLACSARASTERSRRMFDGHINRAYHCARAIEKWSWIRNEANAAQTARQCLPCPGWEVGPSQRLPSGIVVGHQRAVRPERPARDASPIPIRVPVRQTLRRLNMVNPHPPLCGCRLTMFNRRPGAGTPNWDRASVTCRAFLSLTAR